MAWDEALLEHAAQFGRALLRLYGWTEPAATFGYFQRHAEIAASTPLRPLIRRPAGGGLVLHEADWTYAVIVPPAHSWYARSARDSYRHMHLWLQGAFTRCGLVTELAGCCDHTGPGRCFGGGWEQNDLLFHGRKIAGAAQRRNQLGLLIQGSVQPTPRGLDRTEWERALTADPDQMWENLVPAAELKARVVELAAHKYSVPQHNEKR
jgi:lipoate-protein ligase A